jgi:hypothetical protein
MPWIRLEEWMYKDIHITSALHWGELSATHPSRFTPRESTSYPFDRRLGESHRAPFDDVEMGQFLTLEEFELRLLCRWACSQSLHWLHHHMSQTMEMHAFICLHFSLQFKKNASSRHYNLFPLASELSKMYIRTLLLIKNYGNYWNCWTKTKFHCFNILVFITSVEIILSKSKSSNRLSA